MTCSNCNSELPEGTKYCPTCQTPARTTGLTEDSPHEAARPLESASQTHRPPPQSMESNARVALENAVTRDPSVEVRWLDRQRIREWADNRLNHYDALGLDRNADEQVLQSRIAALDRALEQWSKDHDAKLQEAGKEGKRQFQRLKAAFGDRAAYDRQLAQDDRRRTIEDLVRRTLDDVKTSGLLKWSAWERLQRQARDKGLDSADLDQALQSLRDNGVQTELLIEGQAVRSLDDLRKVCGGQGERLIEVFYGGKLEQWLKDYFPTERFEELVRLKSIHRINTHLGAQILLWELGEKRLALEERGYRREVVNVEQWINETSYHERRDEAESALDASLQALNNRLLESWLDRFGPKSAGRLAKEERMKDSGAPGLWRVIWKAESEAGLQRRRSETAYGQTKKLVSDYPNFAEGHFNHAINCALLARLEETAIHLRKAIEINSEYANKASKSPYFEKLRWEGGTGIDSSAARPSPPGDPDKKSQPWFRNIPRPAWWSLAALLVVVVGWLVWPLLLPTRNDPVDFDYSNPRAFREKHEGGVAALAFAPGGAGLVTGGIKKDVNLWDVTNGEIRQSLKIGGPGARAIAVSSDGKLLATVSKEIRVITIWDLHEGGIRIYSQSEEEKSKRGIPLVINNRGESSKRETVAPRAVKLGMRLDQEARAMAFSPDNQFLAGAGESQVKLWDVKSEQEIQFSGEEAYWPVAFSPDGKWLASGGPVVTLNNGVRERQAIIWDLPSGKLELLRLGRNLSNAKPAGKFSVKYDLLGAVAFSPPDGKWLASGYDRYKAAIWDVKDVKNKFTNNSETPPEPADTKQISLPHNPKRLIVATFSPSGDKLVTVGEGEKTFKLWLWNGTSLIEISPQNQTAAGNVTSAAFSDDGKRLAIGYDDGMVKIWEGRARRK